MSRSIAPSVVALCWGAAALGGCSAVSGFSSPIATYGPSNVLSPAGYAQTKIDDTHFKVTATGTEATPKERVEKIARARAAQLGVDQKLAYFKVASVQHGVSCTKRQSGYKSEDTAPSSRPTVVLDVLYAKDAADPTFASSKEAFETLSNELANEVVPPEAKAVAIQETRTSCGKG